MTQLYDDLAGWWPLFSAPAEYAEEAALFHQVLGESCNPPPRTLLELGSGGGNNALHLKAHYALTLSDVAPHMLSVSRSLNPECEHIEGDMRTLRLGRTFDAVFVHDAIGYMTGEADLRAALLTAFVHCRPGGVALFVPDHVRETFAPGTDQGGEDGDGRSVRWLEWMCDADSSGSTYCVDYAILLREGSSTRVVHDRHTFGLFARADWLRLLREAGFDLSVRVVPDQWGRELLVAKRGL